MPSTRSKTFRKSVSPSNTRQQTRKSIRETQVIKFGKMRGKSVLNTIRKLRIDAYIQYARNAKFLLRFGSIPHLRMYRTLRTEHEMYADFSAKYPPQANQPSPVKMSAIPAPCASRTRSPKMPQASKIVTTPNKDEVTEA